MRQVTTGDEIENKLGSLLTWGFSPWARSVRVTKSNVWLDCRSSLKIDKWPSNHERRWKHVSHNSCVPTVVVYGFAFRILSTATECHFPYFLCTWYFFCYARREKKEWLIKMRRDGEPQFKLRRDRRGSRDPTWPTPDPSLWIIILKNAPFASRVNVSSQSRELTEYIAFVGRSGS